MKVPFYIRKAIREWSAWRTRNRLYAAVPALRDLDARIAENARQHREVRKLERLKVQVMATALARECGRVA